MKKRNIILIVILIIIILISVITFLLFKNNNYIYNDNVNKMNSSNSSFNNISITQYKTGTLFKEKQIKINNDNDIRKLSKYVEELKPLTDSEMVDLELLKDVEIKYDNYITIVIQLEERNYCYYTNTKENVSSLSKMPQGFYEWIDEKIKK